MAHALTIVAPPYRVQSTGKVLRDGFPYFDHHESVAALWERKWRRPCVAGIYPFTDGNVSDFDPIFEALAEASGGTAEVLYRPDDYAAPFLPVGDRLVAEAAEAAARGRNDVARDLYLRAAAVFRIARFPINRSPLGQEAWSKGKSAYEKGAALLDPPIEPVTIPFTLRDTSAGDDAADIQAYLRLPKGERPAAGWPLLLFICGLDAYRTDNTPRTQRHVDGGFATLLFEIPGTGDCPAAPNDPTSPDRLMGSVLDWASDEAQTLGFDLARIAARGISTGGYYAFRLAHTHGDRLFAVAAQGGGAHHMFDPEWIHAQNQMEYPFALADALAYKFGYRDADYSTAVARYAEDARKFSLLDAGITGSPTCRLLVLNGMEDSIFPMEDSLIIGTAGDHKELFLRGDKSHMGNPGGEEIVSRWLDDVVAGAP